MVQVVLTTLPIPNLLRLLDIVLKLEAVKLFVFNIIRYGLGGVKTIDRCNDWLILCRYNFILPLFIHDLLNRVISMETLVPL